MKGANEGIVPAISGSPQDPDRGRISLLTAPQARGRARIRRSWSRPLWIIAACALVAVLRLGREALIPLGLALLLAIVLSGVVEMLRAYRIPRALSAAVLLLLVAVAVGGTLDRIAAPAQQWLLSAPRVLHIIELKIRPAQSVLRRVDYIAKRATAMATSVPDAASAAPASAAAALTPIEIFAATGWAAVDLVTVLAFAFLLLAAGPSTLARMTCLLAGDLHALRALQIIDAIRGEVGRYYGTLLLINLCFGFVIGMVMWLLGMPTPALWGVVAGVLNFVPYLGPAVAATIVTLVALVTFNSIPQVLLVLGCYVGLATVEGHIVEPVFLGRRLNLSPVVVLLALWIGGWVWGVAGVVLALPVLLAATVVRRMAGTPTSRPGHRAAATAARGLLARHERALDDVVAGRTDVR
jgi:predicted PurR-regulated permease PerM